MKLKPLLWVLVLCLSSCSTDETFNEEPEPIQQASFRVVGEDLDSVFLFSYNGDLESSSSSNLTSELGVTVNYLTLRQSNDLLSFFSFADGAFLLAQRNITTDENIDFGAFFSNSPGRSAVWGTSNSANAFIGYFEPGLNGRSIGVQDINLADFSSTETIIDVNVETLFQPILFNEKLYFSYLDDNGDYKLVFYDISSKTLSSIVNFDNIPISILIDDNGDLGVVKNGVNASLESYDSNSLSFLGSMELNFNSGFVPGPINNATLSGEKLYYARPFVQPSRFSAGPAFFDFINQEDTIIDLSSIVNLVEAEVGATIDIVGQRYSKLHDVFLVSYTVLSQEIRGGVVQISTNGDLVTNVTFPFVPNDILED